MEKTPIPPKIYPYLILSILIIIAFGILVIRSSNKNKNSPSPVSTDLIQRCPEKWYINKMPIAGSSPTSNSYYILDGQRKEISEFDAGWVGQNCRLTPEFVY